MPRPLNVEQRKADIARIAFDVLAHDGPSGLTIQAVAEALGGSVTKVTHIYPTRADLMRGTVDYFISTELRAAAAKAKPKQPNAEADLFLELHNMIPLGEEQRRQERGRVALISDKDRESAAIFADGMEDWARARLRSVLSPLVDEADIDNISDFLRAFVNGLVLSTTEHPDYWTEERQLATLTLALDVVAQYRASSARSD